MNQLIRHQVRCEVLFLAMLPLLSGCVSWPSLGSRLSSECQIAPPEKLESDREVALKVAADLTAFATAPIKANFENAFKEKATQTFRAVPDDYAACYMLLKTITCVSERSNNKAMTGRLVDYLNQTNACKGADTPPTTRIELDSEKPCVREVAGNDLTREFWNVYYCQVYVHNASDRSVLNARHMKLTDLHQLEGDRFVPWPNVVEEAFVEWPADKSRSIPPGDKVPVSFARIFPPELQRIRGEDRQFSGDPNAPQIRFMIQRWHRVMTSHVDPGTHRFKLTTFFENAPPAEANLELEWSGRYRDSVEAMVEDIHIRSLD